MWHYDLQALLKIQTVGKVGDEGRHLEATGASQLEGGKKSQNSMEVQVCYSIICEVLDVTMLQLQYPSPVACCLALTGSCTKSERMVIILDIGVNSKRLHTCLV